MRQSSPKRVEGPLLLIQTWRDLIDGHNMVWFAKVGRFQAEAPQFPDPSTACLGVRPRLPDAIRAATAEFVRLNGTMGPSQTDLKT